MSDNPPDDKQAKEKQAQLEAKKRHQEALQRVLDQKRQHQHNPQHQPTKPNAGSPRFSPKPIRRGPRGG